MFRRAFPTGSDARAAEDVLGWSGVLLRGDTEGDRPLLADCAVRRTRRRRNWTVLSALQGEKRSSRPGAAADPSAAFASSSPSPKSGPSSLS